MTTKDFKEFIDMDDNLVKFIKNSYYQKTGKFIDLETINYCLKLIEFLTSKQII
jgi:hypothetical protein